MLKDFDLKSVPITELMNEIASRDGVRSVEVRYESGAVAFAMRGNDAVQDMARQNGGD